MKSSHCDSVGIFHSAILQQICGICLTAPSFGGGRLCEPNPEYMFHAYMHRNTHLLVKYGLTHGVVPLQCPCPIIKAFPINVICKHRGRNLLKGLILSCVKSVRFLVALWPFSLLRLICRDIIKRSPVHCDFSHASCQLLFFFCLHISHIFPTSSLCFVTSRPRFVPI